MRVQTNAHTEPVKNNIPVDTIIFPNPTSGDTTPPKANPNAPNKADAIPAFDRSQSIASVLEAVKVSPNIKSNARSNTSYIQKLQPTHNATHRKEEAITIPILPLYNACSGWANLTAEVAEMIMARALVPKQILNIKGENP